MKEVIPGWLMVEVPETAFGFRISGDHLRFMNHYSAKKLLPPGSYEIVGIVTEISEEVAAGVVYAETNVEIVDGNAGGGGRIEYTLYKDYEHDEIDCDTAVESLASLARSNGFEPERTLLIRKTK